MQYKSYKNTTQIIQNYITKTHKGWRTHNVQYSTVPQACLRTDHIIHRPFGEVTETVCFLSSRSGSVQRGPVQMVSGWLRALMTTAEVMASSPAADWLSVREAEKVTLG